ncbi:MAG: CDP-alcohol phosphatidyltransferase family protein [Chitinivibrionales bacterium]
MIEVLKPFYNAVLMPAARIFARAKISPNVITFVGLCLSAAAGWFAATGKWNLAAVFIIIGSCMDGLDGLIARLYDKKSAFGAIFDSTADRLTEIFWLLGIFIFFVRRPVWGAMPLFCAFLAITGSLMVSYVRARSEGAGVPCASGILQRPERIVVIGLCFFGGPKIMQWGLALIAGLAYATVVQRILIAYSLSKKANIFQEQ